MSALRRSLSPSSQAVASSQATMLMPSLRAHLNQFLNPTLPTLGVGYFWVVGAGVGIVVRLAASTGSLPTRCH